MIRSLTRFAPLFVAAYLFTLPALAQIPVPSNAMVKAPSEFAKVREDLFEQVSDSKIPSFSVAVIRDRKIIWEESIGWADREKKLGATPNTLYGVASVSKSITASTALALQAQGMLKLSGNVTSYLGKNWINGASADKVLVYQLLNHTSGIPHLFQYQFQDLDRAGSDRNELLRDRGFLAAEPGSRFIYTNLGYEVLAKVVEKAGEASFRDVVSRTLFKPIGMSRTTLNAWVGGDGAARGYGGDGRPLNFALRLGPDGGAGFLSTVRDLSVYARFHLGYEDRQGLKSVSISPALQQLLGERDYAYERGWGILRIKGGIVAISDGQMAGGTAAIVLIPEMELAAVVLCNQTGAPAFETAVSILNALDPGFEARFGAAIESAQRRFTAPGEMPAGTYEGGIAYGKRKVPFKLNFAGDAHVLTLGGLEYELKGLEWDRGTLQLSADVSLATGKELQGHRLIFSLWQSDGGLAGSVQEEIIDKRPRSGIPYRLIFTNTRREN